MDISALGEFELIARLTAGLTIPGASEVGIGMIAPCWIWAVMNFCWRLAIPRLRGSILACKAHPRGYWA
ncbi:hypothetical protein [Dictyobacter kobayashii]|uniref:hypothetical protein n=1 Tax=Dictyobacter kobayashii TaxID=2014872 RepID=UPI000F8379B9|nr:hypothetical protein [Dictyobacter kobayashii]